MMSGFQAYTIYSALKLHYTQENFDDYKYNFKTRVNPKSYEKLRFKYSFEKLASKYKTREDLIEFYTSNFIAGCSWVMDMNETNLNARRGRLESLTYRFKTDINKLSEYDFNELCSCKDGENILINEFCKENINIETISMIDLMVNFIKPLLSELNDPLGMKRDHALMAMKYKNSLTNIDRKKIKENLLSLFTKEESMI